MDNELVEFRLKQIEQTLEKIWTALDNRNLEMRVLKLETQLATLRGVLIWLFPSGLLASVVVSWLLR